MSGDSERDAPRQHPTERELFEEWLQDKGRENLPSLEKISSWKAFQAGRAPLLNLIKKKMPHLQAVNRILQDENTELKKRIDEKDAEIEHLHKRVYDAGTMVERMDEEIEQLNAKVAMYAEKLNELHILAKLHIRDYADYRLSDEVPQLLSATEQDVTRWVNNVKADALEEAVGMNAVEIVRKVKQLRGEK